MARKLLSLPEIASAYIGATWQEAMEVSLAFADHLVYTDGEQLNLDGQSNRQRFSLASLPPGSSTTGFSPPYDDGSGECLTPPEAVLKALPRPPVLAAPEAHASLSAHHAFFVTNCVVDTEGRVATSLAEGVYWWAPQAYPHLRTAAAEFMQSHPEGTRGRPLSGVITVAFDNEMPLEEYRAHFAASLSRVRRLRTLLNVQHAVVPTIIAHDSSHRRPHVRHLSQEVYTNIQYRHFSQPYDLYHRRLSPAELAAAGAVAFASPGGRSFTADILRALDSLDLARDLDAHPISLVLTWAAIECLITPGKEEREITTNLALCLVGLSAPLARPDILFKCVKDGYGVRSGIVHSFRVPSDEEIGRAKAFASHQSGLLLQAALTAQGTGMDRDRFRISLRDKAFTSGLGRDVV